MAKRQRQQPVRPVSHFSSSSALADGSWPLADKEDILRATRLFALKGWHICPDRDAHRTVRNHITRAALREKVEHLIPKEWLEEMEQEKKIDNWWDAALDKQVSLKPIDECKFCRLVTRDSKTSKNKVHPWMATPCDECGKARMAHRAVHPHIIDMGNGPTPEKTLARRDGDCPGFREPNLTDIFASLTRIIDVTQ